MYDVINNLLVSTNFNSVVADVASRDVDKTVDLFNSVFNDLPNNISRIFDVQFDLENRVEIKIGTNMKDLEEVV